MITANFKAYASYVTDSLHQWDLNQVLQVSGLGLSVVPEVHFSNANVDRAIVRQATMSGGTVAVGVPNSLLQDPLRIYAHIGIYEGDTFKVVELVEIPVIPRKRPADYQIQDNDQEIYSFKALENAIANRTTKAEAAAISARIDTIVANANSTDGNSELVDIRVGADGKNYTSAGAAVRGQIQQIGDIIASVAGQTLEIKGAYYTQGGAVQPNNRIHAADIKCAGLAVVKYFGADKTLRYGVDVYTDDASRVRISSSGWMKASDNPIYVVSQSGVIDVSIAKEDDGSFEDLMYMDGLFTVTIYDTLSKVRHDLTGNNGKSWVTSAHRGFVDTTLAENSLAAYYNAYLHGADMIETDARLASDGVLVVNHDPTVTGTNASGQQVTYTVADTPSSALCALALSNDVKWGTQYVPALEQVLHLAYHTGLQVNIDLKNGYETAEAVAKLVTKHGMQGRVVYALNGSGMAGINTIMAIDPDARFIDSASGFVAQVADFAERGKRCYAYTSDASAETVQAIREGGCMVALISLNAANFETAISLHPDMCEYLHTSDFRQIEDNYFENLKLY